MNCHSNHCYSGCRTRSGGLISILGGTTSLIASFLYGGSRVITGIVNTGIWGCHTDEHRCGCQNSCSVSCFPHDHDRPSCC